VDSGVTAIIPGVSTGSFGTVIIILGTLLVIAALLSLRWQRSAYERIGRGAFSLDESDRTLPTGPPPGSAAARAEAEAEIRQLIEAKSARREARGQAPLDIEAEVAALISPAPAADEGLREEVRQLVVARNDRRLARGQPPLDVEEEVDRQLRDLAT
jgi:hypothetical protein